MNSLETEYSFLAPTWKLPTVATKSMYPGPYSTSFESSVPKPGPGLSTWDSTMHNSRYIPPTTNHRTHPTTTSQQHPGKHAMKSGPPPPQHSNDQHRNNKTPNDNLDFTVNVQSNNEYDMSTQSYSNDYPNQQIDNRRLNNQPPPPEPKPKRRVQIIDPNRHTPSTDQMSGGRESQNSYSPIRHTPDFHHNSQKSKAHREDSADNKSDSTYGNVQRPNNFKIHEYLYGLSAPDPGSYVSAYKNQQRRLQDDRVGRKPVLTDYKTFVQTGGYGPTFGNFDHQTYAEKLETEKKKKSYSKTVREANQYKIEEQKRVQNNGGQQRDRTVPVPLPKHRGPDARRSNFLSAQESRSELTSRHSIGSPILTTPLPTLLRLSDSPPLDQASFDTLHPWNQNDLLSGEFYVDRSSSFSSCSPSPRHVRFISRDFARRRLSTFVDRSLYITGINIPHRIESARSGRRKSSAKIIEEIDQLELDDSERLRNSSNYYLHSTTNMKEKKFITSHSMMNSDIQSPLSPPTAMLIINQPYRSENTGMATTPTNNTKKPILIIRSPETPSKTTSRNVRFVSEISADDDQTTIPTKNLLTTQSTPGQVRKLPSSTTINPNMDLNSKKIKANRQFTTNTNNLIDD